MEQIIAQLPGGVLAILTIMLAMLLLCAWKAPRWVKPIGSIVLSFYGIVYVYSFMIGLNAIQKAGDISTSVLMGGLKLTNFITMYALLIYFISRVISFIQKPGH